MKFNNLKSHFINALTSKRGEVEITLPGANQSQEPQEPQNNDVNVEEQVTQEQPNEVQDDAIIDEIVKQVQNKLKISTKSMAKEKGITDISKVMAEVEDRLTNSKKIGELEEKLNNLLQENEKTKALAKEEALNLSLDIVTKELNVDEKAMKLITKIEDFSDVYDKNGKVNKELVTKKINAFLEEYPQFKPTTNDVKNPFVVKGGSGDANNESEEKRLKFNFTHLQ